LENHEASLEISDLVKENHKWLLGEMNEWTGNSGKLTPGC